MSTMSGNCLYIFMLEVYGLCMINDMDCLLWNVLNILSLNWLSNISDMPCHAKNNEWLN